MVSMKIKTLYPILQAYRIYFQKSNAILSYKVLVTNTQLIDAGYKYQIVKNIKLLYKCRKTKFT